jgi:hypothetical protein
MVIASIVSAFVFMPKFREMNFTSVYEVFFLFEFFFKYLKCIVVFRTSFRSSCAHVYFIYFLIKRGKNVSIFIYNSIISIKRS